MESSDTFQVEMALFKLLFESFEEFRLAVGIGGKRPIH
jgi:hypothetical protein